MSQNELDNLVRIGQLKTEPRNVLEVTRMLAMAQTRLRDAGLNSLSLEGQVKCIAGRHAGFNVTPKEML